MLPMLGAISHPINLACCKIVVAVAHNLDRFNITRHGSNYSLILTKHFIIILLWSNSLNLHKRKQHQALLVAPHAQYYTNLILQNNATKTCNIICSSIIIVLASCKNHKHGRMIVVHRSLYHSEDDLRWKLQFGI